MGEDNLGSILEIPKKPEKLRVIVITSAFSALSCWDNLLDMEASALAPHAGSGAV
jgi:hypothetical protein